MQVFVLFDEAGKAKVTAKADEAKRHEKLKGCRVEVCHTQRDYTKNTYYGKTESGEVLIAPGETTFTPFKGASKPTPKAAPAEG